MPKSLSEDSIEIPETEKSKFRRKSKSEKKQKKSKSEKFCGMRVDRKKKR